MPYALVHYPRIDRAPIDAIRDRYDPTAHLIAPHITFLFPVPEHVGYQALVEHIERVLCDYAPFELSLAGFHKSPDHWLLLTVDEGARTVEEIYDALYAGLLMEYRADGIEFVPHLGLGLFLKSGEAYTPFEPRASAFDHVRYEVALEAATAARVGGRSLVDRLHLIHLPDAAFQWAIGRAPTIPAAARVVNRRQFRLGPPGRDPLVDGLGSGFSNDRRPLD